MNWALWHIQRTYSQSMGLKIYMQAQLGGFHGYFPCGHLFDSDNLKK